MTYVITGTEIDVHRHGRRSPAAPASTAGSRGRISTLTTTTRSTARHGMVSLDGTVPGTELERGMDVFRTPDERFEGLPGFDFEPRLPRGRRPAAGAHRRGRGRAGGLLPRRADLVVSVAEGDPAGARRGPPLHRARPRRLRPLRQADRPRLVLLRPPRRAVGDAARATSTCATRRSSSTTGAGRSASALAVEHPGPDRADGDHGHRPVHRRAADVRRLEDVPRLRRAHRGPADRDAGANATAPRGWTRRSRPPTRRRSRRPSRRPAPAPSR